MKTNIRTYIGSMTAIAYWVGTILALYFLTGVERQTFLAISIGYWIGAILVIIGMSINHAWKNRKI